MFTSDPGEAGSGTEVSGSGYARQVITFTAASGGVSSNNAAVSFTASGGSFGTVTHVGIYDALTSGNLLYSGTAGTPTTISSGQTAIFNAGDITITLD